MADDWQRALARWVAAELIDPASAAAIERWEQARVPPGLRAPILVCLGLGAVLLAAGLLLLVAAHWDEMAPGGRFGLAVAVLIALHGAAAWSSRGFPALAVALHGAGSVALGVGIFLVGQLFHLQAHWPAGLLLWAAGAGLGWGLLRQWPQLALGAEGSLTPVELVVRQNRLEALAAAAGPAQGQGPRQAWIEPVDGTPMARLDAPVAFFIPPDVEDPSRRPAGEQLWVEVTLPPDGPPRPIRLGLLRPGRAKIVPLRWRRPHG